MQVAKRFAVTIVGVALLALGVAMMVLPGPGILVIVAGLAVLPRSTCGRGASWFGPSVRRPRFLKPR